MADLYVRSTDGSDADNGTTWALAKATLTGAAAIDGVGDRIFLASSHNESTAAAVTINLAGTNASPTQLLSVGSAGDPSPVTTLTAGAVVASGAGNYSIAVNGSAYVYGVRFNLGVGSGSSPSLSLAASDNNVQTYESCIFDAQTTGSVAVIACGSQSSAIEARLNLKNCDMHFSAVGHTLSVAHCTLEWEGGSILAGAALTNFLTVSRDGASALISGIDLSNLGSATNLVGTTAAAGKAVFRNCKLPASWTGQLFGGTLVSTAFRAELYNCDNADTNYRMWVQDYAGSIRSEAVVVRTGGASDGTTPMSWKMTTTADAEYPLLPLASPEIVIWNETVGSAKTLTIEVITDGVTLTDEECWLDVQYLGTSGVPLGSFVSDAKADVLATAASQATSTEAWTTTGLTAPVKQKLSVTFTPQEKGFIHAVVKLAKASTTVYVCPKADLT